MASVPIATGTWSSQKLISNEQIDRATAWLLLLEYLVTLAKLVGSFEVVDDTVANLAVAFFVDNAALAEGVINLKAALLGIKLTQQTDALRRNTVSSYHHLRMKLLHDKKTSNGVKR